MKKLLILFISVISLLTNALAQNVPQGFNYQAVAREKDGTIMANTLLDIQLSIGSNFSEVHENVLTNSYGLFTLVVGENNAAFQMIPWGASGLAINIKVKKSVDADYQDLASNPIWSVPYALYAGNVANTNTSDHDTSATNELISDMTIMNDTLIIIEGGQIQKVPLPNYSDSDQQQLSWHDPWLGLTNSDSVDLSIGLATEAELQSQSDSINMLQSSLQNHLTQDLDTSSINEIQQLTISGDTLELSNGGGSITLPTYTPSVTAPISISGISIGLNYGPGFYIGQGGLLDEKLCINVDTTLQINTFGQLGAKLSNGLSRSLTGIALGGVLTQHVYFYFNTNDMIHQLGGGGSSFKILNQNTTSLISAQTNNLQIGTNSLDTLVIKSLSSIHGFPLNPAQSPFDKILIRRAGGLIDTIGMNTLNAVQAQNGLSATGNVVKLGGNPLNQPTLIDIGNYILDFKLGNASSAFRLKSGSTDLLTINPSQTIFQLAGTGSDFVVHGNGTNASNALYIKNNGNVGIGTPSPETQLHVSGTLKVDNGGILYVDNKVGIGTPNPEKKLHVNGSMIVSENAIIGNGDDTLQLQAKLILDVFSTNTTLDANDKLLFWDNQSHQVVNMSFTQLSGMLQSSKQCPMGMSKVKQAGTTSFQNYCIDENLNNGFFSTASWPTYVQANNACMNQGKRLCRNDEMAYVMENTSVLTGVIVSSPNRTEFPVQFLLKSSSPTTSENYLTNSYSNGNWYTPFVEGLTSNVSSNPMIYLKCCYDLR